MKDYKLKGNMAQLKRKRDMLLKKLGDCQPFVDGSIVKVRRRCGNKNCKCAVRGEKHESLYLQYQVKQVTKAVYIPVDFEKEVKKWSEEYRRVKEIMQETCLIQKSIIRSYVKAKRLKGVRKW